MRREWDKVTWDQYWISNNPSMIWLEKKLKELTEMQDRRIKKESGHTGISISKRQHQIDTIKQYILNKKAWN